MHEADVDYHQVLLLINAQNCHYKDFTQFTGQTHKSRVHQLSVHTWSSLIGRTTLHQDCYNTHTYISLSSRALNTVLQIHLDLI